MATTRTAAELLSTYPDDVRKLAIETRRFVTRVLPDIREGVDATAPLFGYSYAPGYRGMVATIILSRTGVKLGLVGGAGMPDPHNLLHGTGKVHRYVPLRRVEDLKQPGLGALLELASKECRARLSAPPARNKATAVKATPVKATPVKTRR